MKMLPQVLFWLGTHYCPVLMAGLVLWAADGNGKASACKY